MVNRGERRRGRKGEDISFEGEVEGEREGKREKLEIEAKQYCNF